MEAKKVVVKRIAERKSPAVRAPLKTIQAQPPAGLDRGSRRRKKRPQTQFDLSAHVNRLKNIPVEELSDEQLQGQLSVVKSLLDPNTVQAYRLVTVGGSSTTAGGVLSGFASFDPSNVPMPEYTYLTALFDQVRLVEARIHICNINPHSDGYAVGNQKYACFMACDPGLTATTPGSVAAVVDCPNMLMWNLGSTQTFTLTYKARGRAENAFARTSVPAPGPYAGCYGQFQWYNSGLTVSLAYFTFVLECFYQFTSRT